MVAGYRALKAMSDKRSPRPFEKLHHEVEKALQPYIDFAKAVHGGDAACVENPAVEINFGKSEYDGDVAEKVDAAPPGMDARIQRRHRWPTHRERSGVFGEDIV